MSNVQVLNIKPLTTKPKLVVEIDGKRYTRAAPTLRSVIEMTEDIESLATSGSMAESLKVAQRVILRAFPELDQETLLDLEEDVIDQLFAAARGDVQVETEDAGGNAQPAS